MTDVQSFFDAQGADPDAIARRRKIAEALIAQGMDTSPIQSPWQGAARLAQALVGGLQERSADAEERAGRQQLSDILSKGGNIGDVSKALAANPYGRGIGQELLLKQIETNAEPPKQEFRTLKNAAGAESLIGIETKPGQEPKFTPYNVAGSTGGPQPTTVGEKSLDTKFGPDLTAWSQGGFQEAQGNLQSLDHAIKMLETGKNSPAPRSATPFASRETQCSVPLPRPSTRMPSTCRSGISGQWSPA
jgi:hypothetical protein